MDTRDWRWDDSNLDAGQRPGKKAMRNGLCMGDRCNEAFDQPCQFGHG